MAYHRESAHKDMTWELPFQGASSSLRERLGRTGWIPRATVVETILQGSNIMSIIWTRRVRGPSPLWGKSLSFFFIITSNTEIMGDGQRKPSNLRGLFSALIVGLTLCLRCPGVDIPLWRSWWPSQVPQCCTTHISCFGSELPAHHFLGPTARRSRSWGSLSSSSFQYRIDATEEGRSREHNYMGIGSVLGSWPFP